MTLDAAFAARWLSGTPDWNALLRTLEETTASQPINDGVKQRMASFRKVFGLELSELEQIPLSSAETRMKFDAGLLLLVHHGSAPEHLLRASILTLIYLENNPLRAAVGFHFASAMMKIWLQVCERQGALLFAPSINIPALREACVSDLRGLQKAARIVLAAIPAVGMRLEPRVNEILQRLAAQVTVI